ncbi:hypothetical protein SNEBB_010434 [Seison nebaliae]|nr:hypothetical protein SNEBB_010434 [Seison nebaliae]
MERTAVTSTITYASQNWKRNADVINSIFQPIMCTNPKKSNDRKYIVHPTQITRSRLIQKAKGKKLWKATKPLKRLEQLSIFYIHVNSRRKYKN